MILGHAFPPVVEAIERAARNSASFGASTAAEADLAERISAAFRPSKKCASSARGPRPRCRPSAWPALLPAAISSSSSKAAITATADGLLVKAGSGVATFGIPGSAGVPEEIARLTIALPYNGLDAVEAAFAAHPDSIAAVILEPIVGNAGCILPAQGYLAGLRSITANHGALLIADEVMTGFRVALGGACELYSLDPDLVTSGQDCWRRPSCRASSAARRRFMDQLAPLGPVYQAGTLSGNPLAMAAGLATVSYLQDHAGEVYPRLEATAKALAEGVAQAANHAGIALTTNRVGSMWTWFFTSGPVAKLRAGRQIRHCRIWRFPSRNARSRHLAAAFAV